jgi:hypothetical protein
MKTITFSYNFKKCNKNFEKLQIHLNYKKKLYKF